MTAEQIQAKLDALKNNTQKSNNSEAAKFKFKPKEGKTVIRLLPNYAFGENVTFLPLNFYYDFSEKGNFGKTWLAPHQFDEQDAIYDFNQDCLKVAYDEQDKTRKMELFKMANKFQSKPGIFVVLLVRDQEQEGIKFWNVSVNTMKQLEAIIDDPDYGNIFDLKTGRDITVEYIPKEKSDNGFPKINILPKPKESPATTDKELLSKIVKNPLNVMELYTKPTYEETKIALDRYMSGVEKDEQKVNTKEDDFLEDISKPVTPKPESTSSSVADLDIDFDNLFDE